MKKNIVIILIFLLLIPALAYSGFGKATQPQPGLKDECKNWKKGDDLPGYLLEEEGEENTWGDSPCDYILSVDNEELLWSLIFSSWTPDSNISCAAYRLLNIIGINDFGITFKKRVSLFSKPGLRKLKRDFKGRCLKIRLITIPKESMPYEEAEQILEKIKKEIEKYKDGGILKDEDVMKVYLKWQKKYSYKDDRGNLRIKIGSTYFYFSTYTKREFPSLAYRYNARTMNKETISALSKAREGDLIIIQEYMHEDDRKKKARSEYLYTDTHDRMVLYIILDEN